MLELEFMNRASFTKLIEDAVHSRNMTYLDAIVLICSEQGIELEDVKKFVSPVIKDKLEAEAIGLNLLPRQNTLIFE